MSHLKFNNVSILFDVFKSIVSFKKQYCNWGLKWSCVAIAFIVLCILALETNRQGVEPQPWSGVQPVHDVLVMLYLCFPHFQSKLSMDFRRQRQSQDLVLMKANVIAGTLSSIGSVTVQSAFRPLARQRVFDCIIIDEVQHFALYVFRIEIVSSETAMNVLWYVHSHNVSYQPINSPHLNGQPVFSIAPISLYLSIGQNK